MATTVPTGSSGYDQTLRRSRRLSNADVRTPTLVTSGSDFSVAAILDWVQSNQGISQCARELVETPGPAG